MMIIRVNWEEMEELEREGRKKEIVNSYCSWDRFSELNGNRRCVWWIGVMIREEWKCGEKWEYKWKLLSI